MTFEEFEKAKKDDLRRKAKECFERYNNPDAAYLPDARNGYLLEAQFYMQEMDRRHDSFISLRDLVLELIVILLIGGEILMAWEDSREQGQLIQAQTRILEQLDVNTKTTAIALQTLQTTTNSMKDAVQRQLATALSISVEITYDRNQDRIIIANHGQTDITLWGDKLDQETPVIEKQPMVVTRGGQSYIIAKAFRKEIMKKIADGSIKQKPVIVPFEVYLKDGKDEEYIARCKFLIAEPGDPFQIYTQTTSIIKKRWSAR